MDHVKESEFQANEMFIENNDAINRTISNRHGIRVVFRQIGEVGRFDAQTFLINLVTALGLLAAATTFVDMLMVYVLPQKLLYSKAKTTDVHVRGGHGATATASDGYIDGSMLDGGAGAGKGAVGGGDTFHDASDGIISKEPLNSSF